MSKMLKENNIRYNSIIDILLTWKKSKLQENVDYIFKILRIISFFTCHQYIRQYNNLCKLYFKFVLQILFSIVIRDYHVYALTKVLGRNLAPSFQLNFTIIYSVRVQYIDHDLPCGIFYCRKANTYLSLCRVLSKHTLVLR